MKKGYTLIEMIVVVGVIALTLPVLFTIIFAVLNEQVKLIRLSEVKRQGDNILGMITTSIRNDAISIYNNSNLLDINRVCNTPMGGSYYPTSPNPFNGTNMFFKDKITGYIQFYQAGNNLYKSSGIPQPINTGKIRIQDFTIKCTNRTLRSTPTVILSFNICYNNNTDCSTGSKRVEENATLYYQTVIKLRNYEY